MKIYPFMLLTDVRVADGDPKAPGMGFETWVTLKGTLLMNSDGVDGVIGAINGR